MPRKADEFEQLPVRWHDMLVGGDFNVAGYTSASKSNLSNKSEHEILNRTPFLNR